MEENKIFDSDEKHVNVNRSKALTVNSLCLTPPIGMNDMKIPKKRRLNNLEHVKQALASLYNEINQDKMELKKGGKLCYILCSLARIMESTDLEKRIAALEKKL